NLAARHHGPRACARRQYATPGQLLVRRKGIPRVSGSQIYSADIGPIVFVADGDELVGTIGSEFLLDLGTFPTKLEQGGGNVLSKLRRQIIRIAKRRRRKLLGLIDDTQITLGDLALGDHPCVDVTGDGCGVDLSI